MSKPAAIPSGPTTDALDHKAAMTAALEKLIGPPEAAKLLGVPTSWVYSASESGRPPSFRIGKYVRFRASELLAWLEAQRNGNGGAR